MTDGTPGSTAPSPAEAVTDTGGGLDEGWSSFLADDFPASSSDDSESPATEASSGQPPAAESRDPQSSEGASDAEPAGQPPASAATNDTPDESQGTPTDWAPFSYSVDGQSKDFEGGFRTPDGMLVFDADTAEKVAQRFSQADHYFARDRQSQEQLANLNDAFTRLTSWKVTGPNGQQQVLTGIDGVEAQRVALGRAIAEVQAFRQALKDPSKLASLVTVQQNERDGQWYLVPNQEGIQNFEILLDRDGMRVENMARTASNSIRAQLKVPAVQQPQTATVPDGTSPVWSNVVDRAIERLGVQGLTAEDKAFLASIAPKYVRDSTAEERPTLGAKAVDQSFFALVKDRADLRAATAKTVTNNSKAATENAAAMRAASVGKRPATPSTPTPTPKKDEAGEAWDRRTSQAASMLRRRSA